MGVVDRLPSAAVCHTPATTVGAAKQGAAANRGRESAASPRDDYLDSLTRSILPRRRHRHWNGADTSQQLASMSSIFRSFLTLRSATRTRIPPSHRSVLFPGHGPVAIVLLLASLTRARRAVCGGQSLVERTRHQPSQTVCTSRPENGWSPKTAAAASKTGRRQLARTKRKKRRISGKRREAEHARNADGPCKPHTLFATVAPPFCVALRLKRGGVATSGRSRQKWPVRSPEINENCTSDG